MSTTLERLAKPPVGPREAATFGAENWVQVGWMVTDPVQFWPLNIYQLAPSCEPPAVPVYRREQPVVGKVRKACPACGNPMVNPTDVAAGFTCGHTAYLPSLRVPRSAP